MGYGLDVYKRQPVEPQKRKIVLFAFVLSLLIPATILLIKKSLDTKVRDKKDVVCLLYTSILSPGSTLI